MLKSLDGSSEVEVASLRNLSQFVCTVVGLRQFVVSCADFLGLAVILALSVCVELTKSLDLIDVLCLLLLELGNFEKEIVDLLAELVALVRLLTHVALKSRDINLLASDLISGGTEVLLHVTYDASLLIEEESQIVHLLLEANDGNGIGVVLVSEFTVLHNLLIMEVSVLGLN